jgi:hypothetical protein
MRATEMGDWSMFTYPAGPGEVTAYFSQYDGPDIVFEYRSLLRIRLFVRFSTFTLLLTALIAG